MRLHAASVGSSSSASISVPTAAPPPARVGSRSASSSVRLVARGGGSQQSSNAPRAFGPSAVGSRKHPRPAATATHVGAATYEASDPAAAAPSPPKSPLSSGSGGMRITAGSGVVASSDRRKVLAGVGVVTGMDGCGCKVGGNPTAQKLMVQKAQGWDAALSFLCCMGLVIVPSVVLLTTDILPEGTGAGKVRGYLTAATIICSFFTLVYLGFLYKRKCGAGAGTGRNSGGGSSGDVRQRYAEEGRTLSDSSGSVGHGTSSGGRGRGSGSSGGGGGGGGADVPGASSRGHVVDQATWLHVDYHNKASIPTNEMSVHPMYVCALCTRKLTEQCNHCTQAAGRRRSACTMTTAYCGHAFHFHCIGRELKEQMDKGAGYKSLKCPIDRVAWRYRSSVHKNRWHKEFDVA